MNIFLQQKKRKVFIPCTFETGTFGYWIDASGKLYKDNIIVQSVNAIQYNRIKNNLFKQGEKTIFYTENGNAFIEDKEKIVRLKRQGVFDYHLFQETRIREYCRIYGGCTVYIKKDNEGNFSHYTYEVYH